MMRRLKQGRKRLKTLIKPITAFIIAWVIATPVRAADDPAYISLGAGATGVIADRAQGAAFNILSLIHI